MKHHKYNPEFQFVLDPQNFDKYTDRNLLQYCLGATMYMPGTKDFYDAIVTEKYPGLTSMVMCFEDACDEEDVPKAQQNCIKMLDELNEAIDRGIFSYENLPLLIFRVRSVEQFKDFMQMLKPEHVHLITGFNFPKFNSINGARYFGLLEECNAKFGEILYGMPILEDRRIAYKEHRIDELGAVKRILDEKRTLVLNIRVGATDFSSIFGARRDINYTIYDIMTVRDILTDILNVFTRDNDYTVSGPVWEYFRINKSMKFQDKLPEVDLQESLLRREPLINDALDGLMRELILDKANGFVGKTIIHPSHINYVNGMLAVTKEEYDDALQIIKADGGVLKSTGENRMNEVGPHQRWAERIMLRAQAYGVIKNERDYLNLFGSV